MEEWLEINKIPKEEKLDQAVSALTEDAYAWWLKEGTPNFYKKPIQDWEDLKFRMHQEFVEKLPAKLRKMKSTLNSPIAYQSKSKEVFTHTLPKRAEDKKTSQAREPTPTSPMTPTTHTNVSISTAFKEIQQLVKKAEHLIMSTIVEKGLGTKPNSEPRNGCEMKINKEQDIVLNSKAKNVEVQLSQSVYNDSMTGIMHLPFSNSVEIGTGHKVVQLNTLMPSPCQRQPREQAENKKVEQKNSAKKRLKETNVSSSEPPPTVLHQGKYCNSNEFKDQTCYRCHKKGHYAATCSLRNTKILEEKIELSKTSDSLIQSDLVTSNSSIMHLSLPNEIDTCLEEMIIENKVQATTITNDQRPKQDIIKINKEDMCLVMNTPQVEKVQILIQLAEAKHVSTSIPRFIFDISWSDIMHLFLSMRIYTGDSLRKYKAQELILEQARKQAFEVVPAIALTLKSEADQGTREKESLKEEPTSHTNNAEGVSQVSFPLTQFVSHDATSMLKSLLNLQEHEETICLKPGLQNEFAINSAKKLDSIGLSYPKEPMMHLFLAQNVNLISGTKEANHKEVPPHENLFLSNVEDQKAKPPMVTISTTTKGENANPEQSIGVILSYLLKGEPPDMPNLTKPQTYQGKTLNSQRRMKANLLYLDADYIVSRSKPCQEREYDVDIKTPSAKEHGFRMHGVENMKLRRAKETCELNPAQMEVTIDHSTSTSLWNTHSTHPELTTKKNHPQRMNPEEDIEDSIQKITNGREGDMRSLNQVYLPNQKDLRYKSTFSRHSTHQGITEKNNWFKISSYEEDIQRSSQQTAHEPEIDQRLLNEGFRSYQEEPSCKPTCFRDLTHQRHTANWIQVKINYGLEDIQFLNQEMPSWPNLEAHKFNHLLNRLWRPGEPYNHSGDSSNHPGGSIIILPCTSIQGIRRILSCSLLSYLNMFTLGATTHQRLVCLCCCVLDNIYDDQNVPEKLTYPLKPTRYKGATPSPIYACFTHYGATTKF